MGATLLAHLHRGRGVRARTILAARCPICGAVSRGSTWGRLQVARPTGPTRPTHNHIYLDRSACLPGMCAEFWVYSLYSTLRFRSRAPPLGLSTSSIRRAAVASRPPECMEGLFG